MRPWPELRSAGARRVRTASLDGLRFSHARPDCVEGLAAPEFDADFLFSAFTGDEEERAGAVGVGPVRVAAPWVCGRWFHLGLPFLQDSAGRKRWAGSSGSHGAAARKWPQPAALMRARKATSTTSLAPAFSATTAGLSLAKTQSPLTKIQGCPHEMNSGMKRYERRKDHQGPVIWPAPARPRAQNV